jgi:hypothetical protein
MREKEGAQSRQATSRRPSVRRRSPLRFDRIRRLAILAITGLGIALCLIAAPGVSIAAPSEHPFELLSGSFHVTPSTFQAGAHEDLTTSLDFAHDAAGKTYNDPRTVIVNLPPGFIGNNTAVPTCTQTQLNGVAGHGAECPPASQVGTIELDLTVEGVKNRLRFPVYNMEVASRGIAAQLGFHVLILTQVLNVTVRPGDSGLTVTTPNIETMGESRDISVTIWGLPAAEVHDTQRGQQCENIGTSSESCTNPKQRADIPVKPFLSNPTSCGPTSATIEAYSWEEPNHPSTASTEIGPTVECERVPFEPSIEVRPTTNVIESPSGLDLSLLVPQSWDDPFSISTAHLKDTVVTLPAGYTINPSAGSGLGVCTPQQLRAETFSSLPGDGCPSESKIGTVVVETPVLAEKLTGAVYVAKPYENPFGSLLALYLVVKSPERGIIVKLAGEVHLDPTTGQIVTRFDNNPQVPFSAFTLSLHQGATSPLASPTACGDYRAEAEMTPWSAPLTPLHLAGAKPVAIEAGLRGGACPSGGVPPFAPAVAAGTLNNSAGAYSPLSIRITRNDGEQEITRFSSQFPPGLSAKLAGVPFCPDASIEAAKHRSGAQEETEPSCLAASEIGHTLVGAGVGSVLAWTPGKVYMAGPYNGAPFSIVAITSAKVGPFDLGTVVVREALKIDPITAAVTVDASASDPIPHIIDGIVIHVRDIRVFVDRPQFMINPTSCERMSLAATVDGAGADFTNPADQVPVTITSPFQLANCQNLQFKPHFQASVTGKNSKVSGAGLTVKIAYPNAPQGTQANIHAVKVELPKQLPSRLTTLQKACLASVFEANPASCPAASVVGHATAITTILPVPLSGPAYFVSNGNARFPELIMVLQGYGITIDLHGETFIDKHGITSSTFHQVPDQPVTSFELTLPQAANSALAANTNLCTLTHTTITHKTVKRKVHGHTRRVRVTVRHTTRAGLKMPTEITAQNGMVIHQSTPIAVTGCPKMKAKRAKKVRHGSHRRRRG